MLFTWGHTGTTTRQNSLMGCTGGKFQRATSGCPLLVSFSKFPVGPPQQWPWGYTRYTSAPQTQSPPPPAQCGWNDQEVGRCIKTNDLQGEVSSLVKCLYVFNSSPLLANLPKNKGWGHLLLGYGQATVESYSIMALDCFLFFCSTVFLRISSIYDNRCYWFPICDSWKFSNFQIQLI